MRVLLAGYHGQENLGDDLTDLLTVRSIVEEFGDIELYLLNFGATPRPIFSQTSLVEGIVDSSPTTRGHVRRTEQVWFDVLDQQSFDLVAVNNSSMYGSGKTNFEIGAIAQRLGIRTRYLCLKEYLSKGYYGDFQKAVLAGSECAIFRDADHGKDLGEEFLGKHQNVLLGVDMALFTPSVFPAKEKHNAILLFPRWGEDNHNSKTTDAINTLLDRHRDKHFMMVAGSHQDESYFRSFWHQSNLSILSIGHSALDEICRVISGGQRAISFGRHHGVVVAAAYGLPCAYAIVGDLTEKAHRVANFAREFGIPSFEATKEPLDSFVANGAFTVQAGAGTAIRKRIDATLKHLPGLSPPEWAAH